MAPDPWEKPSRGRAEPQQSLHGGAPRLLHAKAVRKTGFVEVPYNKRPLRVDDQDERDEKRGESGLRSGRTPSPDASIRPPLPRISSGRTPPRSRTQGCATDFQTRGEDRSRRKNGAGSPKAPAPSRHPVSSRIPRGDYRRFRRRSPNGTPSSRARGAEPALQPPPLPRAAGVTGTVGAVRKPRVRGSRRTLCTPTASAGTGPTEPGPGGSAPPRGFRGRRNGKTPLSASV